MGFCWLLWRRSEMVGEWVESQSQVTGMKECKDRVRFNTFHLVQPRRKILSPKFLSTIQIKRFVNIAFHHDLNIKQPPSAFPRTYQNTTSYQSGSIIPSNQSSLLLPIFLLHPFSERHVGTPGLVHPSLKLVVIVALRCATIF